LARTDIKDAIDHVVKNEQVDADNVFLLGLSGGGHMALLMCGFCPTYFKAVGAFVPITDLKIWTEENASYKKHVLACCENSEAEMLDRSPISYIDAIARANVKIFHGKYDPVVPVSQSETLYRVLAEKHPEARVFLDIFDGKHELDMTAAAHWILTQYGKKQHVEVTG
jgi:dipeptidyl aminopeptidase/acylaminoacyl peptidase